MASAAGPHGYTISLKRERRSPLGVEALSLARGNNPRTEEENAHSPMTRTCSTRWGHGRWSRRTRPRPWRRWRGPCQAGPGPGVAHAGCRASRTRRNGIRTRGAGAVPGPGRRRMSGSSGLGPFLAAPPPSRDYSAPRRAGTGSPSTRRSRCLAARRPTSVRLLTPSFSMVRVTWFFTVCSRIPTLGDLLLESPFARRVMTSSSRAEMGDRSLTFPSGLAMVLEPWAMSRQPRVRQTRPAAPRMAFTRVNRRAAGRKAPLKTR